MRFCYLVSDQSWADEFTNLFLASSLLILLLNSRQTQTHMEGRIDLTSARWRQVGHILTANCAHQPRICPESVIHLKSGRLDPQAFEALPDSES